VSQKRAWRWPLGRAAAIAAFAALLFAAQPASAQYAYITNEDSGTVSVIATASNTVAATIAVGSRPYGVAVTPDGSKVYVANANSGTVSVIATASNTVAATITVGTTPQGVAVTPDGSKVYVTNFGSHTVSVIATASNTVTDTITVGNGPQGVAVTPDGGTVYVANEASNDVSVIATASDTVETTISAGSSPTGVAVTPDGSKLYVANEGNPAVSVISTATNTITTTVEVGAGPVAFGSFIGPSPAAVTLISPSSGLAGGGTSVTITGTSFTGATAVEFGGTLALFEINSSSSITAIAPAGSGTVDVTVTTPAGTSATSAADRFTYIPTLTLTSTASSATQVGQSYSQTNVAGGGTSPYTYSVSAGTLPAGITLSTSAGTVSGTPTTAGPFSYTIEVTDSGSPAQTATQATNGTITPATLTLAATASATTQVGQAYSQTNVAGGGTSPYTYSLSAGTLPAGTTLNTSTGTVSGMPSAAGTFAYTIGVTDSGSPAQTATQTLSGTIAPATLTLTATASSATQVGQSYRQTNVAGGGTTPYTYSVSVGTLPAGTRLNSSTGTVFGTPTVAGAVSYTIKATDSGSPAQTATQATNGTITPATLTLSATASATTQVGQSYVQSNAAGGGTTPYTYSVSAGTLPAGTTLNTSTGTVSGTPTAAGAFSYTIEVTDSGSPAQTATQATNGTITPATLTLAATASVTTQVGQAYSQTNVAGGGTTPYTYSLSAGTLPAGTTLNTSTGTVSGTPTASGAFAYTIEVTDSGSPAQTATRTVSGAIAAATPTVTAVSPNGGPPAGGTSVTITGTNLSGASAVNFGGSTATRFAVNSATSIIAIAPAEAVGTVDVTVTTGNGTSAASTADHFTYASPRMTQQGPKLVGSHASGNAEQGASVSLSADGNTAIVGGPDDNANVGAAWIFSRNSARTVVPGSVGAPTPSVAPAAWTQTGSKLVGTGASGAAQQGYAVALSGDGNTALVGGYYDNSGVGAVWVFTRNGGFPGPRAAADAGGVPAALTQNEWSQQGGKLVAGDEAGAGTFGISVALSSDGNTAIIGGYADGSDTGAAWIFTRSNGVWSEQAKLVGSGATGNALQGIAVALSGDGNTALVGGYGDNANNGAAWVFVRSGTTWSQQGSKLLGSGNVGAAEQGYAVALSSDGNTALVGGFADNAGAGAGWIFSRSGGAWTQVGSKLVGTGAVGTARQGLSVALSADASTAALGGYEDDEFNGAVWVFTQSGGAWTQFGSKLDGSGAVGPAEQGSAAALSANGTTLLESGAFDNAGAGAAWVFVAPGAGTFTATPNAGQGPLAVTFSAGGLTPPLTYTVNFGDGTTGALNQDACIATSAVGGAGGPQCSASASHTYINNGTDTATLLNASGIPLGSASITVNASTPSAGK
jgi:YVTN family beta-propeller protein